MDTILNQLGSEEAAKLIKENPNIIIIDVRTKEEYSQGHIPGAILMDYYSNSVIDKINELNPQIECLVYCASGMRSQEIVNLMVDLKFKKINHLQNGFMEWKSFELPFE